METEYNSRRLKNSSNIRIAGGSNSTLDTSSADWAAPKSEVNAKCFQACLQGVKLGSNLYLQKSVVKDIPVSNTY